MKKLIGLFRRPGAALRRLAPVPSCWHDQYSRTAAFLVRSDHWEAERIAAWQLRQLNHLLGHAFRHCRGHARKLRAAGFCGCLERLEDLCGLPFFTKEELRTQGDEFIAENRPSKTLRPITSGGTTGTPTRFMVDAQTYDAVFDAWRHAMWRRAGYDLGARALDLTWAFSGGGLLRPSSDPSRIYLSIHALDASAACDWWSRVRGFQPKFIVAFPSTATAFAKLVPAPGAMPDVRGLLLASETLTSDQSGVLRAAFPQARIFQWYGMSELAGFASGCEHADTFHHWPQSGVLELIGEDGHPVQNPGESGEIVLTGFANLATPFIRYRTGDRATLGNRCPQCKRTHLVLTAIDGRLSDFLLGQQGRVVPISALNFHSDEFRLVFAHQFVQEEPGRVVLRVVPLPGFTREDESAIIRLVGEKLGGDVKLTIEQVTSIPRTPRGKQPLIVQRCPPARHHSGLISILSAP